MKKIIALLLLSSLIYSCGENEGAIYNPNGQGLVYFATASSNLPIVLDGVGQVTVSVNSSSLSNVDRTVTIEILDSSTADPQNYSLPTTVVIPANEYSGTLTINGVDVTAETAPTLLVLKIVSINDQRAAISSANHEVSVFQSCPVDSTKFIGNYLIEETTTFVDGPTLSHNTVVELKHVDANAPTTERRFSTRNYPNYCAPFRDFFFNLLCGEVIVRSNQASTCQCTADGLFFGPAITPETFDPEDDSEFFVTFTNDVTGNCGTAVQTTYKFTKQ